MCACLELRKQWKFTWWVCCHLAFQSHPLVLNSSLLYSSNPNLSSLDAELTDEEKPTEWPLFTDEGLEYKDLTPDMLNGRGIKARECRFWNEFVPQLIKTAGKLVTSRNVYAIKNKVCSISRIVGKQFHTVHFSNDSIFWLFPEDAKKCKESSSRWTQDGSSDSETCTKDKCPDRVPEE